MRIRMFKVLIRITKSLHLPYRNCKFFYLPPHSTQHLFIRSNCEHLCLVGRGKRGESLCKWKPSLSKRLWVWFCHLCKRLSSMMGMGWSLTTLPKIITFFFKYAASNCIKARRHQSPLPHWCVHYFRANSSSTLNELAPFVYLQHKYTQSLSSDRARQGASTV